MEDVLLALVGFFGGISVSAAFVAWRRERRAA